MTEPGRLWNTAGLPAWLKELLDVPDGFSVLARLDEFCRGISDARHGSIHPTAVLEGDVHVAETARIGPGAYIRGPAWIGENVTVGHAAFLRDGVVLADGSSVNHASEVKRSLILPGARLPHFNYAGDSVVGAGVNLGAGVKIANFNAFGAGVKVPGPEGRVLPKAGALIGDSVSIGCNAVLAPGTVVGPRTIIYSGANVRGVIPGDTVVKLRTTLELVSRT